jgi:glucokinase
MKLALWEKPLLYWCKVELMARVVGVAIDVGATRVRVCIGDKQGRILHRASKDMRITHAVEEYVKQLVAMVREEFNHVPKSARVEGIGVASMGPLDLRRGGATHTPNLPYSFVPLVEPLKDAFDVEVALINDANAAVLGEKTHGAGKGHQNMVYVTISTGIGGGAIVDGHLLIGKDGNAAEVGHVVVDTEGRLTCGCGRKGHWEAYCSGRNLPNLARLMANGRLIKSHQTDIQRAVLVKARALNASQLFKAAGEGDRFARSVVLEAGRLNAIGLANTINMYDPSLITIGGGVALNNPDLLLGPIRRFLRAYAINRLPEVMITPLGDDAGILGALSVAFNGSVAKPAS